MENSNSLVVEVEKLITPHPEGSKNGFHVRLQEEGWPRRMACAIYACSTYVRRRSNGLVRIRTVCPGTGGTGALLEFTLSHRPSELVALRTVREFFPVRNHTCAPVLLHTSPLPPPVDTHLFTRHAHTSSKEAKNGRRSQLSLNVGSLGRRKPRLLCSFAGTDAGLVLLQSSRQQHSTGHRPPVHVKTTA